MRPLLRTELAKGGRKDIIRVIDGRVVVVLDPDESKVSGVKIVSIHLIFMLALDS